MTGYKRNDDIVGTTVEDEVILMSIDTGMFYTLTGPMAEIWLGLTHVKSLDDIVADLMKQFDISKSECLSETQDLIAQMLDNKIIEDT